MGGFGGGQIDTLDMIANNVLTRGSVAQQNRDFATYEQLKAQDPDQAKRIAELEAQLEAALAANIQPEEVVGVETTETKSTKK